MLKHLVLCIVLLSIRDSPVSAARLKPVRGSRNENRRLQQGSGSVEGKKSGKTFKYVDGVKVITEGGTTYYKKKSGEAKYGSKEGVNSDREGNNCKEGYREMDKDKSNKREYGSKQTTSSGTGAGSKYVDEAKTAGDSTSAREYASWEDSGYDEGALRNRNLKKGKKGKRKGKNRKGKKGKGKKGKGKRKGGKYKGAYKAVYCELVEDEVSEMESPDQFESSGPLQGEENSPSGVEDEDASFAGTGVVQESVDMDPETRRCDGIRNEVVPPGVVSGEATSNSFFYIRGDADIFEDALVDDVFASMQENMQDGLAPLLAGCSNNSPVRRYLQVVPVDGSPPAADKPPAEIIYSAVNTPTPDEFYTEGCRTDATLLEGSCVATQARVEVYYTGELSEDEKAEEMEAILDANPVQAAGLHSFSNVEVWTVSDPMAPLVSQVNSEEVSPGGGRTRTGLFVALAAGSLVVLVAVCLSRCSRRKNKEEVMKPPLDTDIDEGLTDIDEGVTDYAMSDVNLDDLVGDEILEENFEPFYQPHRPHSRPPPRRKREKKVIRSRTEDFDTCCCR